jgi:hypothetical protein
VIPPHRAASRAKWETGLIRVNVHDLAVWDAYDCVSFPAFGDTRRAQPVGESATASMPPGDATR